MPQVPSARYDTILCCEVLEHLPRPELALAELYRLLRPGGHLILSVPFLCRLHEEPHDYFRFTEHGLAELLSRQGFVVNAIVPTGGLFSFLGHQVSSVLMASVWRVPLLREVTMVLNAGLVVAPSRALDRLSGVVRSLPVGYVVVAAKTDGEER